MFITVNTVQNIRVKVKEIVKLILHYVMQNPKEHKLLPRENSPLWVQQKQEYTLREHVQLPNQTLFFTWKQDAMRPNLDHIFILSHIQSVKEHTEYPVKYPEGQTSVCLIRHQMSLYGVCWENQAALTGDGPAHKNIHCANAVEWNRYLRMIIASRVVGCVFKI